MNVAIWQHVPFDAFFESIIGWLHHVNRGDMSEHVHLFQRVIAQTDGSDLSLLVKLVHRSSGFLNRDQRIRPMNLIDIDVVGL